jgi:hypothetical protein
MIDDIDTIPFGPAPPPAAKKAGQIPDAFAWRTIPMLESPAYRTLSLSAHRVLARLEIELARRKGAPSANGDLICTYDDFAEYGLHPHAIGPAIRELVALGFIEITEKGKAGVAGFRKANKFRLTYRHSEGRKVPSDEWRRIKSPKEAETRAASARKPLKKERSPVRLVAARAA